MANNALASPPPQVDDSEWINALSDNYAKHMAYAKASQNGYSTTLDPQEELIFRQWASKNAPNFNPDQSVQDYDMRGFWKGLMTGDPRARQAINKNDGRIHFDDKWKTPYHQSFSNESMYATPMAPHWNALNQLMMPMNGAITFDERKQPKEQ